MEPEGREGRAIAGVGRPGWNRPAGNCLQIVLWIILLNSPAPTECMSAGSTSRAEPQQARGAQAHADQDETARLGHRRVHRAVGFKRHVLRSDARRPTDEGARRDERAQMTGGRVELGDLPGVAADISERGHIKLPVVVSHAERIEQKIRRCSRRGVIERIHERRRRARDRELLDETRAVAGIDAGVAHEERVAIERQAGRVVQVVPGRGRDDLGRA
jgi:hypothetical protein